MDADYAKKRLEKDLIELKRMCDDHFKALWGSTFK